MHPGSRRPSKRGSPPPSLTAGGHKISTRQILELEKGWIKKRWRGRLPVALVFPNTYPVGMSSLGFQLVYGLANADPLVVCERFFLPPPGRAPVSIESGRPLADFPVVLVSCSFEEDFIHLLAILDAAAIPALARDRLPRPGPGQPLIIIGGIACAINPEPLAPFADLIVLGEAEGIVPELLLCCREDLHGDRASFQSRLASSHAGIYAPAFYHPIPDGRGSLLSHEARAGLPTRIAKARDTLPDNAACSVLLSPQAEFANLHLVELGRGCSRGCRFCAAGFVCRPPRLWSADAVIRALDKRPAGTERIGLLGMEMAREEDLVRLAVYFRQEQLTLSFSSLRADALSPSLLSLFGEKCPKSIAIAPDGSSERLRRVINKGLDEETLLAAADKLAAAGLGQLKIYAMIGLPTETDDDILELVRLLREIRKVVTPYDRRRGQSTRLTVSLNSFVPKAWTPFQYHPFASLPLLAARTTMVKKGLAADRALKVMAGSPKAAMLQAVIARGDRGLGEALLFLARGHGPWQRLLHAAGIDYEDIACRQRRADEIFPWDIVDQGVDKKYLWREYQKALAGQASPPCDTSICKRCGVCHALS